MNAPLPDHVLKALASLSLDDKYTLERGRAFMSGIQALVRLPILQQTRDAMAGLHTAGFISGYRGSPLGGYDQALWKAKSHLSKHNIVFQPGVNEELGATAVWGTQQLDLHPETQRFDGVFGLWYGKGPGVDRSADALKHANMAGTAKHGGVIAVAGDDHAAKSSSLAHQSDHIFKACGLPVFFPSSVQEILDLGLHAYAMSRYAGLWAGMKAIQEVVESATTVDVDPDRVHIVLPHEFAMPEGGLNIRWPDTALEQEARLMNFKWYAALAYIRANRLNQTVLDSPHARLGLIASGKAYNDLRRALHDLGLDDETCRAIGLRVHKVAVVWPLEASATREFATGLQEILVIEEKRQMIEYQLKEELYNWREDVRPNVLGKFCEPEGDQTGGEWSQDNPASQWLLRAQADLNPALIAKAVAQRIEKLGLLEGHPVGLRERMRARLEVIEAKERSLRELGKSAERAPWFCSGCPHNTSTRVPGGSRALAGIGCHYMAMWMGRHTETVTQMGGEGVNWIGQAPFTTDKHVFVNLGDGTYFHSGVLAIRQSVAAKVNVTYKILYNDAVAMTGGQPLDGNLSVAAMTRELEAEGVRKIVVVTDDVDRYEDVTDLALGVTVHPREALDVVQRELRETEGCTAIIYEQTCATEKRRRRKRGTMPKLAKRVVINERVCEGCGDCSAQSNCLSVESVETEFGRKRRINQSSCNQDFSCVKGFCPSFVTVIGGKLRAPSVGSGIPDLRSLPLLPEPELPSAQSAYGIVVAGIGGTGVITIGQVLGMAAHLEGKGIVTQESAGLAQKGGATWSHVQIADRPDAVFTTKVGMAEADLVMGCDPIVAAHQSTVTLMRLGKTRVALNTHETPTADLVQEPGWQFPSHQCNHAITRAVGADRVGQLDAVELATRLLGDAIYANPLMLGYAWQRGWVPLSLSALRRAIELNAVQVEFNLAAFEWGRHAAHDLKQVLRWTLPSAPIQIVRASKSSVDELIQRRFDELVAYQDEAYAQRYLGMVRRVQAAERALGSTAVTEAVARQLFKLMAYKDEYEVARWLTDPAFISRIHDQFEGDFKLELNLAPPWLAHLDAGGQPAKRRFGQVWLRMLKVLPRFKSLRGTWLDPFAYSKDRRLDREVLREFEAVLDRVARELAQGRHVWAADVVQVADLIKGYGHVRERHIEQARAKWRELLA